MKSSSQKEIDVLKTAIKSNYQITDTETHLLKEHILQLKNQLSSKDEEIKKLKIQVLRIADKSYNEAKQTERERILKILHTAWENDEFDAPILLKLKSQINKEDKNGN